MGATCSTIQHKYVARSNAISVIPADKEQNIMDERAKRELEKERVKQMDREKLENRINPLQNSAHQDEVVPVEVLLTRMWNSVVCAELVKGDNRCVADEGTQLKDVIALMRSMKSDYVMVKKLPLQKHTHHPSSSNPMETVSKIALDDERTSMNGPEQEELHHGNRSRELNPKSPTKSPTGSVIPPVRAGPASPTPRINQGGNPLPLYEPSLNETASTFVSPRTRVGKQEHEDYLGLVDWRDINTFLVKSFKKSSTVVERKQSTQLTEEEVSNITKSKALASHHSSDDDQELSDVCVLPTPRGTDDSKNAPKHSNGREKSTVQVQAPIEQFTNMHDMMSCPIQYIINLSERNPLLTVSKITPLLGGVNLLVGSRFGKDIDKPTSRRPAHTPITVGPLATHPLPGATSNNPIPSPRTPGSNIELYRLPVLNNDNYFLGCISQLACAKFIAEKLYSLGNIGNVPLSECSLGTQKIQTINWSASLLSALVRMSTKYLSSLAIIDSSGKLVGTISCSDVKFLLEATSIELMNILYMPVSTVISAIRSSPTFWHINLQSNTTTTEKSYNHTLTLNTPLHDAIKMLLTQRVRRMWVVNENDFPIGVMSISDIVKLLLPKNPNRPKTLISRIEKAKV